MSAVVATPNPQKLKVPVECYMALEQLLQSLRVYTLEKAATAKTALAKSKVEMVQSEDIDAALAVFLQSPGELNKPRASAPIVAPSQEAFLHLENRLHSLRVAVAKYCIAEVQARSQAQMRPDDIRESWDEILGQPEMLHCALGISEPSADE